MNTTKKPQKFFLSIKGEKTTIAATLSPWVLAKTVDAMVKARALESEWIANARIQRKYAVAARRQVK